MTRLRISIAYSALVVLMLVTSGCAGKKIVVKDSLSTDATEEEKKEFALRLFKEGAELLFVDNQVAVAKFDAAREIDPTLIPAYFNAGVAFEALGQPLEASQRYEACLQQNKEQTNCLDNWVLTKVALGQVDEAEQRVEQYLNEYPDKPFAMVAAAKLALVRKDYARAERFARQAIEREAENVEALFVMARIFYERKQYPAAKWVLKNAIEIAPSHGGLHLALGHTETALGLLHDALDSYQRAVKTQPTDEALESLGLLLLKRGRVTEALPLIKRLAEIRPTDGRNLLHLGNAYMANKMFDEAKTSYFAALEKKPDELDVNFNLGLLYYDLKPKDLPEIDRLKTSKNYFEAFLKKPSLSKDRLAEVKEYIRILTQKIEMEEYAAESAKAAEEEEEPKEEPPEEPKPENNAVDTNGLDKEAPEAKEEKAPAAVPKEEAIEQKEKEQPKKGKEPEKKRDQPEGFEEEEEDFFDDL